LPRVAVLIETSTSWGREVIRGIHKYTENRRPWQLYIETHSSAVSYTVPRQWEGDGMIARIASEPMLSELLALRLPLVNVSAIQLPGMDLPRVQHDTSKGAQMAARYFFDRGFRHFAYFSLLGFSYVATHEESFREEVRAIGGQYFLYEVKAHHPDAPDWNLDEEHLASWLRGLPKPVGLLVWNAHSGRQIVYACQRAGLRIPEDIALLSGADDDLLCELSHIPISSMRIACEQIGFQAAEILDRLMRGERVEASPVLVPPTSIISRRSTNLIPFPDQTVVAAMQFIRANAARPIQVPDVARHVGVARRVLERRFIAVVCRTPAAEIRRVHLERAQQLLGETDRAIPEVAEASGFGSPEYMAQLFKAEWGQSPLQYRKMTRGQC